MIIDRIIEWAQRQPDRAAVIANGTPISYAVFSNAIQIACDFFRRQNLPIGRTAIVLVSDLLDAWIIVIALRALGLNTISINSIPQVQSLKIRDIGCIVVTQTEAPFRNVSHDSTGGVKVVTIHPAIHLGRSTNELLVFQRSEHPFGGHILYTSGTTGAYKKVFLSSEHEDRRNLARAQFYALDSKTIYHGINYGLWTGIGFKTPAATWHTGGCVILDQRNDFFETFFSHPVTFTMLMPPALKELLHARRPLACPVRGLDLAVGGSALSFDLVEQSLQTLTDKLSFVYGSTELSSLPLRSRIRAKDDLVWFTPTKEDLVQIVDENGKECEINQEGELRILLSDLDCHGYLDEDEATAKAFRDGYFYPGDMAIKREDGRIRVLGRTADVVILNAQKVATAPIEQAIQRYLQVEEVCIFSGLSKHGHEEVIVAIESDRVIQRSQLEIAAREFVPSERVRFSILKEFPRTEAGMRKIQRALLKKIVIEEIDGHE